MSSTFGGVNPVRGEQVKGGGELVIVRLNGVGPAPPTPLLAVMFMVLIPPALGFPVNNPAVFNEAHAGSPVPLHVIGAVPLAVNW